MFVIMANSEASKVDISKVRNFPSICAVFCDFNPVKDQNPVDQVGFVDLRKAFLTATIPGDLSVDESRYNGVEEPASLVGRPSDVFDAIRKGQYVQGAAAPSKEGVASSAETE